MTHRGPPPLHIPSTLSSNQIKSIIESDAEDDTPHRWNPVKSRRSLKRSGSNGMNYSNGHNHPDPHHTNHQSRNHTPTNYAQEDASPKRNFSYSNKHSP